MAWNRDGKAQVKSCTAPAGGLGPQSATMRLNNRPADAQTHAGAVRFRRKERIENLFRELRRKPWTGIADRNKNLVALRSLRHDDQFSCPFSFLHRFDAVDD